MKSPDCQGFPGRKTLGALAALFFCSSFALAFTSEIEVGTEVGQRYPNITLPSLADGKLTSLSEWRGKKIILLQFASW